MIETVTVKRIEILADSPLAPVLVKAAAAAGIAGYTLIPVRSGAGRSGSWREGDLSGAESKTLFLTIARADKADRLVEALAPILDSHGLLLIVGDVQVVRGERF